MNNINLESIISAQYPSFSQRPKLLREFITFIAGKLLYIKEINSFIEKNKIYRGIGFVDEIFDYLNFTFRISHKDIKKIPSEGRLIIVANHPIGSLDGLALLNTIASVRPDIKILANDILMSIENISEFLIPIGVNTKKLNRDALNKIGNSLNKEEAVIVFPAGEVSRLKWIYINDSEWNKGALHFAQKYNSPVLPVYIKAKNSFLFYLVSVLNKHFSRLLLVHELFNKRNKTISLKIGDPIPAKAFANNFINTKTQAKLLKKHTYRIGTNKKGIFITQKNIIHPVNIHLIKKEFNKSEKIGSIGDDKHIFITDYENSPYVLHEIARLREVTFRKVGEGTGNKLDLDKYDKIYKHIIVWDSNNLEIVGAYRVGIGSELLINKDPDFYSSTLFNFSDKFMKDYFPNSIELGRSFIQQKYWNSNALNLLWMGIGAFLAGNSSIKYMFGPVSISNNYPLPAKEAIVFHFSKWFGSIYDFARSKNRFTISHKRMVELGEYLNGKDDKENYNKLKHYLKPFGFTVPVLYKHYSELCSDEGVKFLDFGTDPDFYNCIDGLILVDIDKIKQEKKGKYIMQFTGKLPVS